MSSSWVHRSFAQKSATGSYGSVGSTCSGLVELPTYGPRRCRQALPALERPLRRMSTFERPSTYGGCTFEPVVGVAKSWQVVCLQVAASVNPSAGDE